MDINNGMLLQDTDPRYKLPRVIKVVDICGDRANVQNVYTQRNTSIGLSRLKARFLDVSRSTTREQTSK